MGHSTPLFCRLPTQTLCQPCGGLCYSLIHLQESRTALLVKVWSVHGPAAHTSAGTLSERQNLRQLPHLLARNLRFPQTCVGGAHAGEHWRSVALCVLRQFHILYTYQVRFLPVRSHLGVLRFHLLVYRFLKTFNLVALTDIVFYSLPALFVLKECFFS